MIGEIFGLNRFEILVILNPASYMLTSKFGKFLKPKWLIPGSCYKGSDFFQFTSARAGLL